MNRKSGFTLIELLAAVAILMIIVWVMAAIFTESDRAWNLGTGRANNNTEGRAGIQMLSHDLQYALADSVLTFKLQRDRKGLKILGTGGSPCEEICFVSIQHDSSGTAKRAAREIHYYVKQAEEGGTVIPYRYELHRAYWSAEIENDPFNHCYHNPDWWDALGRPPNSPVIVENLVGFRVYVPNPGSPEGPMITDYDSKNHGNRLPEYIDVMLEVVSDREAEQITQMKIAGIPDQRIWEFVELKARRYTTRVAFHNRHGHKKRVARN